MKRYAIGDIHGCFYTLKALLDKLKLSAGDKVYLLGDLINKGPRSKQVLDYLIHKNEHPCLIISIRGNHDERLVDVVKGNVSGIWNKSLQTRLTLQSFEVTDPFSIPDRYIRFLDSLPYYIEEEGYILVHAGINFYTKNYFVDKPAMLNLKKVDKDMIPEGIKIIAGHIPQRVSELVKKDLLRDNLIRIDTGCPYYKTPDMGVLTALDLDTMELTFQKNLDLSYQGGIYRL